MLVGHPAGVPDPGQQLGQPRLAVRGRRLDLDQPRSPADSSYSSSSPETSSP